MTETPMEPTEPLATSIAQPKQVEAAMQRELTETESLYVGDLLARAERLLLPRIPDLRTRAGEDPIFSALVADIESEAVARVLRAPGNGIIRQEAEGNYSYSINLRVASGLLEILADEWARLGVSTWRSIAPETDGYAAGRYDAIPPHWWFQYGWPAKNQMSEEWNL